jgi:ribonuclease HII
MICGIDEAGRGAVLGPLVVAGVCFYSSQIAQLRPLGIRDSKLLTPAKREALYETLLKLCSAKGVVVLTAREIDARVANQKTLNTLEVDAFKTLLSELSPQEAYIDSVFRAPEKLKTLLEKHCKARLIVEHKADVKYAVVGAASIIAKVVRDRAIRELEALHGLELGSGYPSDPTTVGFLMACQCKGYDFIRTTWAHAKKVQAQHEQKLLSDQNF